MINLWIWKLEIHVADGTQVLAQIFAPAACAHSFRTLIPRRRASGISCPYSRETEKMNHHYRFGLRSDLPLDIIRINGEISSTSAKTGSAPVIRIAV